MMLLRKKKLYIALPILLLLFLISTSILSGTFARYANAYAGADTALVARWSFTGEFNDAALAGTNAALPIWDHTYATNIYDPGGNDDLVAPGVAGSFKVEFSYDADVDADLKFKLTKTGDASATTPIQYSIDNFTTVYYDLDKLADAIIAASSTHSTSTITGSAGTYVVTDTAEAKATDPADPIKIDVTVNWRWPYDVTAHNGLTSAVAGVAAARVEANPANFAGTGALIQFGGSDTAFHNWTDDDDTAIGIDSQSGDSRDLYVLNLEMSATQRQPA